jgi:hypothetical protein
MTARRGRRWRLRVCKTTSAEDRGLPALVPVLVRPRELAATSRLGLEGDLVARGLRPLDKAVRVFVPACLDLRTRRGAFGAGAEGGVLNRQLASQIRKSRLGQARGAPI